MKAIKRTKIIPIKLIHVHHVTESNSYKCEDKNLLFKYTMINFTNGVLPENMKHVFGKTEGGSQDDCIDLCNGAEGCQSIFYSETGGKCHLSSIEVAAAPGGDWKTYAKSCVVGVLMYMICNTYVIYI